MPHKGFNYWEKEFKQIFDSIDDYLEDNYGDTYKLHPSRSERGKTSNKAHDGLFNVGATFSSGYGSEYGRGYVVEIDMVTLDNVPDEVEKKITQDVLIQLKKKLKERYPHRNLKASMDRNVIKIYGDLTLGEI